MTTVMSWRWWSSVPMAPWIVISWATLPWSITPWRSWPSYCSILPWSTIPWSSCHSLTLRSCPCWSSCTLARSSTSLLSCYTWSWSWPWRSWITLTRGWASWWCSITLARSWTPWRSWIASAWCRTSARWGTPWWSWMALTRNRPVSTFSSWSLRVTLNCRN
jgi:hypothetical protein